MTDTTGGRTFKNVKACNVHHDKNQLLVFALIVAVLLFILEGLSSTPARAASWSSEKRLTFGVSHTTSTSSTDSPESDTKNASTVAKIEPQFALYGQGRHTEIVLLGEAELLGSDSYDEAEFSPRLYGAFDSKLLRNALTLNGSAQVRHESNATSNSSIDSVDPDGESYTNYTANITPNLELSLTNNFAFKLRYGLGAFTSESDQVADSVTNALEMQLDYGDVQQALQFGIAASVNRTDFSTSDVLQQREMSFTAGKQIMRDLSLTASVGRAWSEIPVDAGLPTDTQSNTIEEDTTWNVAITWKPLSRSSFVAAYGENQFGQLPSLRFRHQTRRSTYTLSWSRGLTRSQARLTNLSPIEFSNNQIGDTENSVVDTITEPVIEVTDNRISILEQISASYGLRGRVSGLILNALLTDREFRFASSSTTEKSLSIRSVLTRQLGRRTSIGFSYERNQDLLNSGISDDTLGAEITMEFR